MKLWGRLARLEKVPQQAQSVGRGQLRRHRAELGQVGDQVSADAGEVGAGLVDVPLDDADGQIPLPHHAVAGAGNLGAQHLVEFLAVMVEDVAVQRQQNRPLKIFLVDAAVVDGDLGRCAGVQRVEQGAVVEEHCHLVIFVRDGVVDVGEGPAFAVLIAHLEDAVRPDAADGDGILHRARDLELHALLTPGGCQRLGQWRASGVLVIWLHGLVVQAVRLVDQSFGHKNLGFDPGPQQLLGRHTVVAEKSAGRKRCSAQDAHPAHLLHADDRPQAKIKAHCRAKRQQ